MATPASLAEDDAERIGRLFDTHHQTLYRLARRLAPDADTARDLVQEVFLRAAIHARRLPRGASAEEAWLVRVLVNLRRDQWRKAKVRGDNRTRAINPTAAPASQEVEFITREALWKALDRLDPRRRAVVTLHELDGMSTRDIASLLGVSVVTVRWHLSRAHRALRVFLQSDRRARR
jgi:RNA polymerase sigma-70 factor (ECF subfamily)